MDFPRGKLPPGTGLNRQKKRKTAVDALFKTSDHFDDGEKKKAKKRKRNAVASKDEENKVIIEAISMKRLPIGTVVVGCVSKVTDFELTFIIAGGGIISVPIYNISDSYSEVVEQFITDPSEVNPFKPQSMFEVGQCLPVKIIEKTEKNSRISKIVGSINPKVVYSEVHPLSLKSFASKIVISAAVTAVEDHGYIMDIGLGDQMNGFLSAADAKDYLRRRPNMNRIPIGCVVLCAGISISSRTLGLTTKKERFHQNIVTGDSEVLPLTSFLAGLKVAVRVMDVSERGLEIIAANEHKGYIHRDYLKSEWDMPDTNYSIADVLEAHVLFVHPVSQLVVCSLRNLPDPMSIEKMFAEFKPGRVISDAKVALIDERGNLILVTKQEKIKLLATKANISDVPVDDTKVMQEYPIGSKQKCKVLSVSYFDQLIRVSLKPSFVDEDCISLDDISVGTVLIGSVKNLTKEGLYLKLGPHMTGFARSVHLADTPQVVHPEKMFPLGKEIKCRVLNKDTDVEPAKISLTCKKSLVSNKLNILDKIEKAIPGFETLGVVVLANKSGVLLEFFSGLQGWISRILLSDYASIESSFSKGQIVKCYVISSDSKTGRINLTLTKTVLAVDENEKIVEHEKEEPPQKKVNELDTGRIVTGKVTQIGGDGLVVQLSDEISTTIPLTQVIDSQYISKRELERRFSVGQEVQCRIIYWSNGEVAATMKPSLLDPVINSWKHVQALQIGMCSIGFISKIVMKQGRLVTFIGGIKGFLKETLIKKNSCGYKAGRLQPGELVACKVIDVDAITRKVSLDLVAIDSVKSSTTQVKPVTSGFSFTKRVEDLGDEMEDNVEQEEKSVEEQLEKTVRTLREKEADIRRKEIHLANTHLKPETVEEHERKVVSEPNSCIGWLEYMSYRLECNQIDEARAVAERALKAISFREENERFNIWVALINLEHFYGDQESLQKVIVRARQVSDPIKIDLRIAKMYQDANETELAEQVYESMMKKSKHDKNFWVDYGMFHMKLKRFEAARSVMGKSLDSLPNRDHLDVISKFAQMEFKAGQIEHGKTLFENILVNYPKRIDVWIVYLSMLIKYAVNHTLPSSDELESVRTVFERVLSLGLSAKKVSPIFKKYVEFEQTYGNASRVQVVKDKSITYVESNKLQSFME